MIICILGQSSLHTYRHSHLAAHSACLDEGKEISSHWDLSGLEQTTPADA
jgi:hypothetical protein